MRGLGYRDRGRASRGVALVAIIALHAVAIAWGLMARVPGPDKAQQYVPILLTLAVTNLLSNALKFLPPGGQPIITIRATTQDELCRLEIADNGIGVPLEDQQRLFRPFVQLHGQEIYEGVGLGLATVRKVVELMGGRVGVTSIVGQGSTFWIELRKGV